MELLSIFVEKPALPQRLLNWTLKLFRNSEVVEVDLHRGPSGIPVASDRVSPCEDAGHSCPPTLARSAHTSSREEKDMITWMTRLLRDKLATVDVFSPRRRNSRKPAHRAAGKQADVLEPRIVLSVKSVVSAGVLTITGSSSADSIRVTQNGQTTWVSAETQSGGIGTTSSQSFKGVKLVKAYGYGGNDKINLHGLPIKSYVYGGSGNDSIYGGKLTDHIYGDAGVDTIYGNEGNDFLNGGDQDDYLYGYIGDDKLYGDAGNDYLKGNDGLDDMFGGTGNDTLIGDAGRDQFWGGAGNDRIEYRFDLDNFFADQPRLSSSMSEYSKSANGVDTWVITLDRSSFSKRFLQPAIEKISTATKTFDPMLDLLNRQVPVVSELAGKITFRQALARVNPSAGKFVDMLNSIRRLADSVGDWSGDVTFGTFKLTAGKSSVEAAVSTVSSNPIAAINKSSLNSLRSAGFRIPILESPQSLVHMMFGRPVSLVEIALPSFSTNYKFVDASYRVPVATGVDVKFSLSAGLGASARGTFGVDSSGLFSGKLITNGFYLRDFGATISANVTGRGGVAIGSGGFDIVGAGVEGRVAANITFGLRDPNSDGKIRLSELSSSTFARSITKTGSVDYRLRAYFEYKYFHTVFEVRTARNYRLLDEGTL